MNVSPEVAGGPLGLVVVERAGGLDIPAVSSIWAVGSASVWRTIGTDSDALSIPCDIASAEGDALFSTMASRLPGVVDSSPEPSEWSESIPGGRSMTRKEGGSYRKGICRSTANWKMAPGREHCARSVAVESS